MKYEVYRQGKGEREVIEKKVTRYFTENKKVAFAFMNAKNKLEKENVWRVALCISDRICFDIDILDIHNLIAIKDFYGRIFQTDFRIIKTLNGYHLISFRQYTDSIQWQYDECRVLFPFLEKENMQRYIEAVQRSYREASKKQRINGESKEEFLKGLSDRFKHSDLFLGVGDFDILFSMNVLFRGKHCIRISKKSIDDNPTEIFL